MKTIIYLTKTAWNDKQSLPFNQKINVLIPLFILMTGLTYFVVKNSFWVTISTTSFTVSLTILSELVNLKNFAKQYKLDSGREESLDMFFQIEKLAVKLSIWIRISAVMTLISFFLILIFGFLNL